MKTITLDKLKPFILQEENPKSMYKALKQIHTADNFSIASNGHMAGIIYNSEDHELNYAFGNSMDVIVSLFKSSHRDRDNEIDYQIILNRKEVLDTIKNQFRALKDLVK